VNINHLISGYHVKTLVNYTLQVDRTVKRSFF